MIDGALHLRTSSLIFDLLACIINVLDGGSSPPLLAPLKAVGRKRGVNSRISDACCSDRFGISRR